MVETTDVCRVEQVRVATPAGADALPDFFKLIRIDTHLGVSPSVQVSPTEQDGGVDTDTFQHSFEQSALSRREKRYWQRMRLLGELLILVLMNLSSSYLLPESSQDGVVR
ncbi:MAG: hypothetical protein WC856_06940 [Methylococcaceae bacterium]